MSQSNRVAFVVLAILLPAIFLPFLFAIHRLGTIADGTPESAVYEAFGADADNIIIRYQRPYDLNPEEERVRGGLLLCGGYGHDPERPIAIALQRPHPRRRGDYARVVTDYAIARPSGRSLTPREAWFLSRCATLEGDPVQVPGWR